MNLKVVITAVRLGALGAGFIHGALVAAKWYHDKTCDCMEVKMTMCEPDCACKCGTTACGCHETARRLAEKSARVKAKIENSNA